MTPFILLLPLIVVVAVSPIVATVLGWIAVAQIRRSQGRLYGLGLAVFDGLLFPLLALDVLIVALCTTVTKMFVAFYANPALQNRPDVDPALVTKLANLLARHPAILFPVIAAIVVVVDFLIVRAVWRAVNRSATPPTPPAVASPRIDAEVPMVGKTGPADFQSLETVSAVLMTPEELGTARGQFGMAFTRGPLVLDGTRLMHRVNGRQTTIPLAAIVDVSLGYFPRAMNPRRLPLICVTYREGASTKRVVLAPWQHVIGLPSSFAAEVQHWHGLIRAAVERATGRAPTETPVQQLNLPRSSPVTVSVMLMPYLVVPFLLVATSNILKTQALSWLMLLPIVPLLVTALMWLRPAGKVSTPPRPRSVWLALLLPVFAALMGVGSFVVGLHLRPHLQKPVGKFRINLTPEGVTDRVVLVRMFTPDPLGRQEMRMHLTGPELPIKDLLIPRNLPRKAWPEHFIFPRTSPANQPWTEFWSAKQTLMGFVLPTPELAQEAYRRLGMGPLPLNFDRQRPPGAFYFDLDPAKPDSMRSVLFDVTNNVGQHFTGQLLFSAIWVRAGHPRWAELRSLPIKKSLNTIELGWEVGTSQPAAMTLRHHWKDGGSESMMAFQQPSPTVSVSVLVYKMTATRVGMRMMLGDQPSTKEFDGDFDAIAAELGVYGGGGRIKTERDWDIELCRVADSPVYLHISDLPPPQRVEIERSPVDTGDPRRFPAVKCFVNFAGGGPDNGCVGDAGTNGTMRCGHPGAVSEVSWSWLRRTPTGDLYQFTRTFPAAIPKDADVEANSAKHQVTTREVEYTGSELVVWDDTVHRIGLRPVQRLQFRLETGANENAETLSSIDGKERLHLRSEVLLDETSVARATANQDATGSPVISVVFTEAGAKQLARITRENPGRRLAIVFDGVLLSAPILRSAIADGRAEITGNFTPAEARAIARVLNREDAGSEQPPEKAP